MNDRQKKVLGDALTQLSAGAKAGKRLVDGGASLSEVQRHVFALEEHIAKMKLAITMANGAGNVIDIASKARAKTLSGSRRS